VTEYAVEVGFESNDTFEQETFETGGSPALVLPRSEPLSGFVDGLLLCSRPRCTDLYDSS
jgi:hypothetical protein